MARPYQHRLQGLQGLHNPAKLQLFPGASDPEDARGLRPRRAPLPGCQFAAPVHRIGQAVHRRPRHLGRRPGLRHGSSWGAPLRRLRRTAAGPHRPRQGGNRPRGAVRDRQAHWRADPGQSPGVRRRDDDSLRCRGPGRQRGVGHADPGRRLRVRRSGRRHRHIPEQHGKLLRAGGEQPKPHRAGQARRFRSRADPDVPRREVLPEHGHPGKLGDTPDDSPVPDERAGPRNERATGHRLAPLQGVYRAKRRHGGEVPAACAAGARSEGTTPSTSFQRGRGP